MAGRPCDRLGGRGQVHVHVAVVIAYVHTTAGAAAGSRSMCGQQAPPRPIARQLLLHVGRSMLDLERECMTAIGYVGPCASLAV